jgi:hypothetical protein
MLQAIDIGITQVIRPLSSDAVIPCSGIGCRLHGTEEMQAQLLQRGRQPKPLRGSQASVLPELTPGLKLYFSCDSRTEFFAPSIT